MRADVGWQDKGIVMDWTGLQPDAVAALLSTLIRCESPDPPGNEAKVTRALARALRDHGLSPEVEEFAPGRFNVLVRIKGRGLRPALVFSAHTDTLPAGTGDWKYPPFSGHFDGTRIHGRGACDMKSGLVAMVSAAVALQQVPLAGDVILAFTGGESSACLGARRLVQTGALRDVGAILISEPTSLRVALAEKAALWLRVEAAGVAGHLSGDAARGNGGRSAILAMMGFLGCVQSALPHDRHPLLGAVTANVGKIAGGTAINLMPDHCVAELDLRLLPHHDADRIQEGLQDMAGEGFTFTRIDLKPAVETRADDPFAALCLDVAAATTGLPRDPVGVTYFSDAAVLCPALGVPMSIMGPGQLGGSGAIDESVLLADVVTASHAYARIAARWLAG
ncbi:MAG: M20 family metallopeptidase [Rhodobacteraceae bacterium]|nr:M20 family metallopeptidase [Paracoccaceae bacterium]